VLALIDYRLLAIVRGDRKRTLKPSHHSTGNAATRERIAPTNDSSNQSALLDARDFYNLILGVNSDATMKKTVLAVVVTIAFSVVGVLGDYFLKLSSAHEQPLRTRWFYVGFVIYASTAFGWVFVMRHLKLATIGVIYSVSMVLLLTAVGVVLFRESLNYYELAGIVLAVVSLVLLVRFA
jgi:small multidrug resistance pump